MSVQIDTATQSIVQENDTFNGAVAVLESAVDGFIACDSELRLIYLNSVAERLLCKPKTQLLGKNLMDVSRDFAGSELELKARNALQERIPVTLECYHHKLAYWLEVRVLPAPGGNVSIWLRDITERKRAEEALRETEMTFRLFVEHAPAPIAMVDHEMRYLAVSRRWLTDYQLGDREIRGLSHYEVFPEIPERWKEIHRKCLAGSVERCEEDPFPRLDGRIDWVRWEIHPWRKTDGRIGGLIMFSELITERKRAEVALRESQALTNAIVDSTADMIWSVDSENFRLLTFNRSLSDYFLQWCGISLQTGKGPEDHFPNQDLVDGWRGLYQRALAEGSYTTEYNATAGSSALQLTFHLLKRDGKVFGISVFGKNITERKRAEEALTQERNLLRTVIDNLPGYVYVKDTESRFLIANTGLARLLGAAKGRDLLGKTDFDFFPNHLAAQYRSDEQEVIRLGQPMINSEKSVVDTLGNKRSLLNTKVPFRDSLGNIIGVVGISQDITERKQAEAALHESERRYRLLFDQMLVGFALMEVIIDEKGKPCDYFHLEINPAFEKQSGLPRDRILGRRITEALPGIEPFWIETYGRVATTGESAHFENYAQPLQRWFEVTAFRTGLRQVGITFADITERKQAENDLRLTQFCVEHASDGIFWMDPQGHILYVNEAACHSLGRSREELLSLSISDIDPLAPKEAWEPYWEAVKVKGSVIFESQHQTKQGRAFPIEVTANYVEFDGKEYSFAFARDITERKRAERFQFLSAEILRTLNEPLGVPDVVNQILAAIQRETGVDAVGIRLRSGNDFPYFAQGGFSHGFLLKDNNLIVRDINEGLCRDENGKTCLECTCGMVISGRTDPANPLFTERGSFWTNNSLTLLGLPADQDPRLHPRNNCIHEGYCSAALIPIRANRDIVGLLQLHDRKKNCFNLEMIHFLEGISASIGVALLRKQQEEALRESEAGLAAAQRIAHIGSWEWNVQTNKARWSDETFHIFGQDPSPLGEHRKSFLEMIHPEDRAQVDQALTEALNGTRDYNLAYRIQLPEGTEKVIHSHAETLRDEAGNALRMRGTVQDITERKRAEEAIWKAEKEYREIFEQALEGIYRATHEGKILAANPALARMLGYGSPEEVVSSISNFELQMWRDPHDRREFIRLVDEQEAVHGYECQLLRKDGAVIWVSVNNQRVRGLDGGPLYYQGFIEDISERKRTEAELADRFRFETLLAELSARFVHVPADQIDGEIEDAQRRVCESLALDACSLWQVMPEAPNFIPLTHFFRPSEGVTIPVGINAWHYLPWCTQQILAGKVIVASSLEELPTEAARDRQTFGFFGIKSVLARGLSVGGGPVIGGLAFSTRTAHPWPEELVKRLQVVAELFCSALERQRSERALRESEERFRSLFENATVGIYRTTPDGRILMANPSLVHLLGFGRFEELAKRSLEEDSFEPEYSRRAFRERLERDGVVSGLEAAWCRQDGSVAFIRESARAIRGGDGKIIYYDGIVEDITGRKRAEEERQSSLEQLRALAGHLQSVREEERTRVAREIHDNLGQALTAIKIDLSLLIHELPPEKKPKFQPILKEVDETVGLVRKISTELRPGILDALGLVAAIEWAADEFETRNGIKCRWDLPQDDMVIDQERATALFRILQETLTNVARHADATEVNVRLAQEGDSLLLQIQDNGKGITEGQASAGSSLGIMGMRERAILLGGELSIHGAPGKGTIVKVVLPKTTAQQEGGRE